MSPSNHQRSLALSRSLVCVLTALAIAAASCSGMHKVPVVQTAPGQPIMWQVKAGDTIRVTLVDGGSSEFRVQSVTPEAIIAAGGAKYEHTNITSVERRGISSGKTAGAVAGGLGVATILVLATAAAVISALFGGGGN